MATAHQQEISRLNHQRSQLLQQRQEFSPHLLQNPYSPYLQPKPLEDTHGISRGRNQASRSKSKSPSRSRGKFFCESNYLRELKRMMDGIVQGVDEESREMINELERIKHSQKDIVSSVEKRGGNSLSPIGRGNREERGRSKRVEKVNSDKLIELKKYIDMIVTSSNQKSERTGSSRREEIRGIQTRYTNIQRGKSTEIVEEEQEYKSSKVNPNSFFPSLENSCIEKLIGHRQRSKAADTRTKTSVQKPFKSIQGQIQRLREQNIRLQTWLNQQIKRNIDLQREISMYRRGGDQDNDSIIHKLKKDDQRTLEQENNILKSKIKNLEMDLLSIEKGVGVLGNEPEGIVSDYKVEMEEKEGRIKELEGEIEFIRKHPMRETHNTNSSLVESMRKQIRYLQDRLKVSKTDSVMENMKRDIQKLRGENQKMRTEIFKLTDKPQNQSYSKIQKLLQDPEDYLPKPREQDQMMGRRGLHMDDIARTQGGTYYSPNAQNLYSVSKSYKAVKGHSRNESQKFSIDYTRPRVQIDLHR